MIERTDLWISEAHQTTEPSLTCFQSPTSSGNRYPKCLEGFFCSFVFWCLLFLCLWHKAATAEVTVVVWILSPISAMEECRSPWRTFMLRAILQCTWFLNWCFSVSLLYILFVIFFCLTFGTNWIPLGLLIKIKWKKGAWGGSSTHCNLSNEIRAHYTRHISLSPFLNSIIWIYWHRQSSRGLNIKIVPVFHRNYQNLWWIEDFFAKWTRWT